MPGLFALCINSSILGAGPHGVCLGFGSGHVGFLEASSLDAVCSTTLDPCVAEIGSIVSFSSNLMRKLDASHCGVEATTVPKTYNIACFGSGGWSVWSMPPSASQSDCAVQLLPKQLLEAYAALTPLDSPALSPAAPAVSTLRPSCVLDLRLHGRVDKPPGAVPFPPPGYPGQSVETNLGVVIDAVRSVYDYGIVSKSDGENLLPYCCKLPINNFARIINPCGQHDFPTIMTFFS